MLALSDEQRLLVETLSDIAEREFADRAFEWDGETPWENVALLADRGFLGVNVATEYGGGGLSELAALLSVETVGRVCPDTAHYLYEQQLAAPRTIEMFGSERLKERYLPGVTTGDTYIAVGISEPGAGSDVASMTTTAEPDGDAVVVNGEKTWVSGIPDADAVLLWVRFPEGLGTLVVDLDQAGVTVGENFTNMAGHTQTQFFLEDVRVPRENVLVRGRDAFKEQLRALNWERLGASAFANALSANALEKALSYAADREQFGQPIGEFQGVAWKLADAATRLQASRALTYSAARAAVAADRTPTRLDASMAKLAAAETAEAVVSEALQVFGANGYQRGHPLEYLYRVARGRRIAAGTDEVQKNQIAAVLRENGFPDLA